MECHGVGSATGIFAVSVARPAAAARQAQADAWLNQRLNETRAARERLSTPAEAADAYSAIVEEWVGKFPDAKHTPY